MSAPVLALLLADSRTPAGGYAHSGGLEGAVEGGLSSAGVPAFATARLETVGIVEAGFAAAAACRVAEHAGLPSAAPARSRIANGRTEGGASGDSDGGVLGALLALDDELAARTPSPPLRAAARQLGRALLRLAERLWPGDALLAGYGDASAWTPRPVVLGAVSATAGLTPLDAARLSLYEDAAGVMAAAVKLLPLDAADATAWVAGLAPRIDALAAEAVAAPPGAALPAAATPLLDLRSLDHDQSMGRLFVT